MTAERVEDLYYVSVDADLDGMEFLAPFSYEQMAAEYNGIGPESLSEKQRKKLTKWLKLFEPACLIHDMRFSVSDGQRQAFNYANMELRDNCLKLSSWAYGWYNWKRYRARFAARVMYAAVCTPAGWEVWQKCAKKDALKPVKCNGTGFAIV